MGVVRGAAFARLGTDDNRIGGERSKKYRALTKLLCEERCRRLPSCLAWNGASRQIRHSKNPDGMTLAVDPSAYADLLTPAKRGELDRLSN
ncbi:hypothetical protein GCM10027456_77150 [Kineosporia babensis]